MPLPSPPRQIVLRGVQVHNLQSLDLDLPLGNMIAICGVSGSGKSSLAFDTLYAEGQRRYVESFSAYTRQFLDRLEKPAAERIEGIPAAIAVDQRNQSRSHRATIATATEIHDHLRLLFARIGEIVCPDCGQIVRRETSQSVQQWLATLPVGRRFQIAFPWTHDAADDRTPAAIAEETSADDSLSMLRAKGFRRLIAAGATIDLDTVSSPALAGDVVVDRLQTGPALTDSRCRDSLETAFSFGDGVCCLYLEGDALPLLRGEQVVVDDRPWRRLRFSRRLECDGCGRAFEEPRPQLFSFHSPLGACPRCEGFGNTLEVDATRVIPDEGKSLRDNAIAPWTTPAYQHEREELLALAGDYQLPVDVPYRELTENHRKIVWEGVPERNFGGLRGFFRWLERHAYKTPVRAFLSRWRSPVTCPACQGKRLQPDSLSVRVGGRSIDRLTAESVSSAHLFFAQLDLTAEQQPIARLMCEQIMARLSYLEQVGLGYLPLDRPLASLSGGESQRVALTSALGSALVHMLYVLDEPSLGLHPRDTERLLPVIGRLRDRGNTVVVVDHDERMLQAADQIVEIGPGAGDRGGKLVFQGTPAELLEAPTLTGDYLARRRQIRWPTRRRQAERGWLRLRGARGHNLQDVTVDFPLGVLCVVTGVSGAGKSTLVEETLYPALLKKLGGKQGDGPNPLPHDDLLGDGGLDDVLLVDRTPISRTPRSNPVTYLKAFDEIRAVFAETIEAKGRGFTAGHFSFNVEGGRCPRCEGDGYLQIDMQFMPDCMIRCPQCQGTRYRPEVLDCLVRGRNIAEVLQMTVREAFLFFRGQKKVQTRLKQLIDVGLDYLPLGQPANTLSGGEAQRMKLAGYMSAAKRGRTLFILDEPTTGLHVHDVAQLLDCFEALLAVGHSLIVVEHHLALVGSADYVIDLGPGAAAAGGQVVARGTPEEIAANPNSWTGRYLAQEMQKQQAAEVRSEEDRGDG